MTFTKHRRHLLNIDDIYNDPPSMLTQMAHMAHMIDKMQASIETLSQEVKDQETRHKNTTKELRQTIQQQNARIEELEKQVNTGETVDAQPNRQDEMISLHRKVEAMATTVTNQQKVLEISERSSRAQNIIIVGLQEEKENENIGDKVQHLLKDIGSICRTSLSQMPGGLERQGRTCSRTHVPS